MVGFVSAGKVLYTVKWRSIGVTRVFSKVGKGTQSNTLICALTDYKLEAEFIKQYGSLRLLYNDVWLVL